MAAQIRIEVVGSFFPSVKPKKPQNFGRPEGITKYGNANCVKSIFETLPFACETKKLKHVNKFVFPRIII